MKRIDSLLELALIAFSVIMIGVILEQTNFSDVNPSVEPIEFDVMPVAENSKIFMLPEWGSNA